jgi:cell wall-associated NlpC family hydrolase
MTIRDDVIAEAESWIGTPYHHGQRVKGAGVDCGQILVGVYSKFGFIPEDYSIAYYPPDFAMHKDFEWYLSIVREFADEISEADAGPADIVLFKWGRLFSHGGIIAPDYPQIIHSWAPTRKVGRFRIDMTPLAKKQRVFFSPFGRASNAK